jgi:hypothetical protein
MNPNIVRVRLSMVMISRHLVFTEIWEIVLPKAREK